MGKLVQKSILAGLLISLGGIAKISTNNSIIGAFLFSIGLYSVILLKADLYTGKIGYVMMKDIPDTSWKDVILILVINLISAFLVGTLYNTIQHCMYTFSVMDKSLIALLVDSILCGICIYLAVDLYKENKLITLLGVMTFILIGADHCIATAFYMGINIRSFSLSWIYKLLIVVIGNSLGSLFIRYLRGKTK